MSIEVELNLASVISQFKSIIEILRWRAQYQPDEIAYTFLEDGETKEINISYAELDSQARNIAAKLQYRVNPGDRAVILYPPGLDYIAAFYGCLYAGVIAVPAYPPQLSRHLSRVNAIVENAD